MWINRICPNCGEKIELLERDLRKNCDLDGNIKIRCPLCFDGIISFSLVTPLTQAEITAKVI